MRVVLMMPHDHKHLNCINWGWLFWDFHFLKEFKWEYIGKSASNFPYSLWKVCYKFQWFMPKKMSLGLLWVEQHPISSNSYFSLEFICTSIANLVLFINLGTTQYNKLDQEYYLTGSRVLIEKKLHLFHLAQNVTIIFSSHNTLFQLF